MDRMDQIISYIGFLCQKVSSKNPEDPESYISQQTADSPIPSSSTTTLPEAGVITGGILGDNLIQNIIQRGNISTIISLLTSGGCIIDRIKGGEGEIVREGNLMIGTSCDDLIIGIMMMKSYLQDQETMWYTLVTAMI